MFTPLLIILVTLLLSGFFSGMEIAFISANRLRIELDKKQGFLFGGIIKRFTNNPSLFLATMLIGNNIALVVYGLLMAEILDPFLTNFIQSEFWELIIETAISTLIILLLAEYLPKSLFRINPNNSLKIFAFPVYLFYLLFYPIASLTSWISRLIIRIFFRVKIKDDESLTFTKHDLDSLVTTNSPEEKKEDKVSQDVKIFQNALDFSEIRLRECMVPRNEIVAVSIDDKISTLRQRFIDTGLSKIMVYENSIDNIIGFAPSIRLFENPSSIKAMVRKLPIVPETMPANKLLESFIQTRKNVALVVDEFGGTSGIVTLEDILEEIVGDIQDEHDKIKLIARKLSDHEFELSGRLEIDDINEQFGINLPVSDDYETLAGLILALHGSIPEENQTLEFNDFIFSIRKVSSTKIDLVTLRLKNFS